MKNNHYKGQEKRKHIRIIYPDSYSPKFNIIAQEFDVKNISEGGLRFGSDKKINIKGWINGKLTFQNGDTLDIDGIVIKKKGNEVGLKFITPLPMSIILKEQKAVDKATKAEQSDG